MPAEINDKISLFVKDQFPAFYAEDGNMFRLFVQAYYEFLEQSGQSLDYSRNLIEYQDIDNTTAEFLDQFKKLYLNQLPGLIKADDRLTIKNIMDFYRAKGSERSIQLLFRIIFDEEALVENPGDDVLKPSTSDFRLPRYIEVYAPDEDNLIGLQGKEIIGATSSAKAFVESISTKMANGVTTSVIQLSNLKGNFLRGEIIASSSDGIQDNMPVVTGSLSSINVTLGGQDFNVGDSFDVIADVGKSGKARVTAIDAATGLVDFQLANGGFGFSTNTSFTSIDVNDQNISVNNVINAAQTYSNTSKIDTAQYTRFETVDQKAEKITFLSGAQMVSDINTMIADGGQPYIVGSKDANATHINTVVANGYIINSAIDGANGTLTIAPFSGSFGNQLALAANLSVNTHIFQPGEEIEEENLVTLSISGTSGSFSAGDVVKGDESTANGVVVTVNSSVMTINGSFGTWTSNDNVQDITSGIANTANVTSISVTNTGANAILSSFTNTNAKQYTLNIHEIAGQFNTTKKIKGKRTNSIAILNGAPVDTGASDIFMQGNLASRAVVDTYANVSVSGQVIGSNTTNIGFKNTKWANGSSTAVKFYANVAAFIVGRDSNTYANVVTVGTGSGAGFKIGGLENQETITIYTDFIGENNVSNVSYLDCVIGGQDATATGANSGTGFLDTVTIRTAGSSYANGEVITFATGGPGDGPPTTNATANVTTNGSGAIISTQVITAGAGFFNQNVIGTIATSGGSSGVVTANIDFGYGFPKDPNGDIDTILDNVLTRFSGNVGTITSIADINPGNNYNFDPFLSVYTGGIAKFDRRDIVVNLTGMNSGSGGSIKDFTIGEVVNQTVTNAGQTLTVNTVTVQNTSASSNTTTGGTTNFPIGASVTQSKNSTVSAIGTIFSSNSTVLNIINGNIKTTFANGLVTTLTNNQPFTSNSTINAVSIASPNTANNETNVFSTISSTGVTSSSAVAKGQVYKFNNNQDGTGDVGLRRLSFSVGFNDIGSITGATSGAGGTVDSLYQDANTKPIGDNAIVNADAKAANGIVTALEITDSGFGYQHNSNLTLRSSGNSNIVVSGLANVSTTGVGPGFWASQESQLNTKYIHDNDFYQSHSYVIETGLSLNKYRDILLKTAHIAGTRLFGRVVKESSVNNAVTVSNSSIGAV